jgi:3-methyladenine DNA glycosylase AlkD
MARVGINVDRALGVSIPALRKIGRRHRPDHSLALDLWRSGIHEARILASMVDDPAEVTRDQMEEWVGDFDSWDLCDQVISNLFDLTPFAASVVRAWTKRPDEFVKRAGFAMIAAHAVHDRTAPDHSFTAWFPAIRRGATDDRNYVKKAVSWALRSIGKRNLALNAAAIAEAERLAREAVALYADAESPNFQGDVLLDLAQVLRMAGRPVEAGHAAREALAFYEHKGNRPASGTARAFIDELSGS